MKHTVTLIEGDGIGPEIMASIKEIFKAANVPVVWDIQVAGRKAFEQNIASGVPQATIDSLAKTKVALKGPLETPVGHGGKSANVTLRKLFDTYANVRPIFELPNIKTPFSGRNIDMVIVRENTEDLYAGIEYWQSPNVSVALKTVSKLGSEKICRFAFELAASEGRNSIHCATKANILKITEGLFKATFETLSKDYRDLKASHMLIDNCAHQLVVKPEQFDVIVMTNMNGDIISDLASGLVGGLGVAPSANIGNDCAIFEAVHGSAPDIAGKDKANPTALLLSAVNMLSYMGLIGHAMIIENALIKALEDGHLTKDLAGRRGLKCSDFTQQIIENLGSTPKDWSPRIFKRLDIKHKITEAKVKEACIGADLFVQSSDMPEDIGAAMEKALQNTKFTLKFISNRGTVVYPKIVGAKLDMVDWWRCRLMAKGGMVSNQDFADMLGEVGKSLEWMHVEKLYTHNGEAAYSKGQGEN